MDLSSLNGSVHLTCFLDGIASFHPSLCHEVCLNVLINLFIQTIASFLCFVVDGMSISSRSVFWSLLGPPVFIMVMTPGSVMLLSLGVRMMRYLVAWLILASYLREAFQARDFILQLCSQLGIVVYVRACLVPSQAATYFGMVLVSPSYTIIFVVCFRI